LNVLPFDMQRAASPSVSLPINDMRSTAAYRLRVAQNLLREFLHA